MRTMPAHAGDVLRAVDEAADPLCPRRAARRALLALVAAGIGIERIPRPGRGYERFLLFKGLNRPLSAWAFLWAPGASTPIHDHRCWCAAAVMSGRLVEERYALLPEASGAADREVRPLARVRLDAGMVSTLEPGVHGIHRIRNASGLPALTVHVYGFDPEEAASSIDRSYRMVGRTAGGGFQALPSWSEFCRRPAEE